MIGFDFKSVQQSIIDGKMIMDKADAAGQRSMFQFGAWVMKTARRSVRQRKSVSEVGNPPSSHIGKLRDFILFVVEKAVKNVVMGPMLLNSTRSKTTLSALEHGGPSLIFERARRRQPAKTRPIMVGARPTMQPAFEKGIERVPQLWQDSIR
jgi:hypothetical protein